MATAGFLKSFYLTHFSKPESDRVLYRIIQKRKVQHILELGLGDGRRAVRMIELAGRASHGRRVSYTGTDLFEGRGPNDPPGISLKEAHCLLGATGARVRLVPGDPGMAMARSANNGLTGVDLVVISTGNDPASMWRAWFYLPRVIHPGSRVVWQETAEDGTIVNRVLDAAETARHAQEQSVRRAA